MISAMALVAVGGVAMIMVCAPPRLVKKKAYEAKGKAKMGTIQPTGKPFWLRDKFAYAVLGLAFLLVLMLTGKIALEAGDIVAIVATLIGTHALTDTAAIVTSKRENNGNNGG